MSTLAAAICLALSGAAHAQTVDWNVAGTGNWDVAANWTPNGIPNGATINVVDSLTGSVIDYVSGDTCAVESITSDGQINLNGGALTVSGNMQVNSALDLAGGTLIDANVLAGTGGSITATSGNSTLQGVTLFGGVNVSANATLNLTGGTTLGSGGTTNVSQSGVLNWNQTGTLSNHSLVLGTTAAPNSYLTIGGSYTLTLDTTTTVSGAGIHINGAGTLINNGSIDEGADGGSYGVIYPTNFTNNGTIQASGGGTLYIQPATWVAGGSLQSNGTGSTLILRGTFNLPSSSAVAFSTSGGGVIDVDGTLSNTGQTFDPTVNVAGTQAFQLTGGTILNGNVGHSSSLHFSTGGGTLSGVALDGGLTLTGSNVATVTNGTTFGTASGINITGNSTLDWNQTGTLSNDNIVLGTTTSPNGYLTVGSSYTLTLDTTTTVSGAGIHISGAGSLINNGSIDEGADNGNYGVIYPTNFTNNGTVTASGAATLYIQPTTLATTGTISATSGATITVRPTNVFVNMGTIDAEAASTISLTGAYSQSAGKLIANGTISETAGVGSITGGAVTGSGKITGSLDNVSGTVSAGNPLGTLEVSGAFTQGSGGTTVAVIGGGSASSGYSVLAVTGAASFDGTLDVDFINGFQPTHGETFDIIDYGSRIGTFSTVNIIGDNTEAVVSYIDTSGVVRVSAVPAPGSLPILGAGLSGLVLSVRRRLRRR